MRKIILYYTCNTHRADIEAGCRRRIAAAGLPIVSVSLNYPIDFGDWRVVVEGKRSPETVHRQILTGLELIQAEGRAEVVFFCENDVLYHPSHFQFEPPRENVFYYNENAYRTDYFTGRTVFYYTKQTSGLCARLDLLVGHYRLRAQRIARDGKFDRRMGFEPGCHQTPRGVDDLKAEAWMSEFPNLDIRHDRNATRSKWSLADFRDKRTARGWREVEEVPYWGAPLGRMREILEA